VYKFSLLLRIEVYWIRAIPMISAQLDCICSDPIPNKVTPTELGVRASTDLLGKHTIQPITNNIYP
jgi:hypothetical protein